jgi:hypothetical protein
MFDDLSSAAGAGGIEAAPPPAPAPGVTGPPPDGSVGGAPPAPPVISWETAPEQLRNEYRTTKQNLDRWNQLGKYEDLSKTYQTYSGLQTEASRLGQYLGFDGREISEAFSTDPAGTVAVLRSMVKKAQDTGQPPTTTDVQALVRRGIEEAMKPLQMEREERIDKEAENRFDSEFDRQFKTSFPHGLPDSNKEAISGLAWQLIIDNADAYNALRNEGNVSGIAQAFEAGKKLLLKIVTDYNEHEKKRIQGSGESPRGGAPPPANGRKGPQTIDEVLARINDKSIPDDAIFR